MALAPGGGGGGAVTGAATGAGAGLIFGPVGAAAGAAVGAAIGVLAAKKKGRRLRKFAALQQRRINKKINQMRENRLIQMDALARAGRVSLGDSLNAAPHNIAVIETLASRTVANVARDQDTIDENLKRGELAAQAAKDDVVKGTESQTENVALAGIVGGLGGAIAGAQLGLSVGGLVDAGVAADQAKKSGATKEAIAEARAKFGKAQQETAFEFLRFARATTERITSKIQSATVRGTFSQVHLPFSRFNTRFPDPFR